MLQFNYITSFCIIKFYIIYRIAEFSLLQLSNIRTIELPKNVSIFACLICYTVDFLISKAGLIFNIILIKIKVHLQMKFS